MTVISIFNSRFSQLKPYHSNLYYMLIFSEYGQQKGHPKKQSNNLPINGNEATMNLNPLILTNIQSSSYFKITLFKLKTYHEVIDEIYYQVKHLEPWERGSRKTSGQTGMCGGVGNVSDALTSVLELGPLKFTSDM